MSLIADTGLFHLPPIVNEAVRTYKPAATTMLSAHFIMQLLRAAGLPDGVINLVYGDPRPSWPRRLAMKASQVFTLPARLRCLTSCWLRSTAI